jgi:hypothetical protein
VCFTLGDCFFGLRRRLVQAQVLPGCPLANRFLCGTERYIFYSRGKMAVVFLQPAFGNPNFLIGAYPQEKQI